jgi:predicted methyltransferase
MKFMDAILEQDIDEAVVNFIKKEDSLEEAVLWLLKDLRDGLEDEANEKIDTMFEELGLLEG